MNETQKNILKDVIYLLIDIDTINRQILCLEAKLGICRMLHTARHSVVEKRSTL